MMEKLFSLMFYSCPSHDDGFFIGFFRTREEAEKIAQRYRREVAGFKDYACDAVIREVPVIGGAPGLAAVYCYTGWNTNEDLDEVDIIESDCFASKAEAEAAQARAEKESPREEWALNRHIIGQYGWQEGFVRVFPGDTDP